MDLPPEGTRISLAGQFGTVRFAGNVDNTPGLWLGIEWDDPSRGKHDGTKDAKRYFSCRIQNAGSFIRPSAANLFYGRSFLDALVAKYVEPPHGSQSQEQVLLGSSNGAIVVEAVRLDKIRGNLAHLERLKEVSLDDENVARGDPPGTIRGTCPNILGLDLSTSLLPSWDAVASIASELSNLQRLALNRNRLQQASDPNVMRSAFMTLTQIQLNGTMMTWSEMQEVTAHMPRLRLVEMGYNGLTRLQSTTLSAPSNSPIEVFNLDSNLCSEWDHIYNSLLHYRSLERVILTSNGIGTIPFPDSAQQRSHSLKHISLSFNKLNAWNDVDALSSWCPGLESLTLSGNPLMDHELGRHSRPFTIARIPSLLVLDGAAISTKERMDSELFYMSDVMQYGPGNKEERVRAHPQWQTLCEKHGMPDESVKGQGPSDKLSNRLLALKLLPSSDNKQALVDSSEFSPLRVLPTMTLKALRMKIRKVMKAPQTPIFLALKMIDGTFFDLTVDDDPQTLDRLGLEDGSVIVFRTGK